MEMDRRPARWAASLSTSTLLSGYGRASPCRSAALSDQRLGPGSGALPVIERPRYSP